MAEPDDSTFDGSPADQVSTLFVGESVIVRGLFPPDAETLVVTFTNRNPNIGQGKVRREGFGEKFLAATGAAYLGFINLQNNWWQTEEVPAAYAAIRADHALSRFSRVITYGASMGAYGALLFSDLVGANLVLAFSPQYSITGDRIPIMEAWSRDLANTELIFEPIEQRVARNAEILAVFDPLNAMDLAHVQALEAVRPCERLVVPFSGHSTALFLHRHDLLKPIVVEGLAAPVDRRGLRRQIRAARRRSPEYWALVAAKAQSRGRKDLATAAERMALSLEEADPSAPDERKHAAAERYVDRLIDAGKKADAVAFAEQWLASHPGEAASYGPLTTALRAAGRRKAAIMQAKAAVVLNPRNSALQLRLVGLLAEGGHSEAARHHLAEAQRGKSANGKQWLVAASTLAQSGEAAMSRDAANHGLTVERKSQKVIAELSRFATAPDATDL